MATLLSVTLCYNQQLLYKSNSFSVFSDRVLQGKAEAKALSSTELISNYKSPANDFLSAAITFKFSINGKDNEMKSGVDHRFSCNSGNCETPVIKFGKQYIDTKVVADNTYLKPQTSFKINLDMREVLNAFDKTGYYTTFNGDKIYKQDFKGVYAAGGTAPLSWDFDNLVNKPELKLKDDDGDGIYTGTIVLNDQKNEKQTSSTWKQSKDVAAFPAYQSGYVLSDALYNMAKEEMVNAVEPDSTFRTGKEWAGVWTRDISYSIILAMAHLQPRVSKFSLMRKVKNGKIIQDTGTGGAWPASTDRMIWAVAAWEVYKVTGDNDWLKQSYKVIKNSAEDDKEVAFDKVTGMIKGESSFLDWREQTYPKWMQPVDIYESECLGTNAVHYQANIVLASMAALLNDKPSVAKYSKVAGGIKAGINKYLWIAHKGYYAQFLYGRNAKIASPRSEALGEALSVIFGIADESRSKQVISKTPVMDYGVPCIYPQIPNIPPYHNNAVWPFVQSFFALAAAKTANEKVVMESIAAIYRPAALFVTNKENFVASNGDFAGTQINSSNMLWSLSGSISLVHKLLFGIQFNTNSLSFQPFVPKALQGKRSLTNFHYRGAVLDIEMEGYGNRVKFFKIDGKPAAPVIASSLKGKHTVSIVLANNSLNDANINMVDHYVTPDAPVATLNNGLLEWNKVADAVQYIVLKNGREISRPTNTNMLVALNEFAEYQVLAADARGVQSFAGEPVMVADKIVTKEVEGTNEKSTLPYKGFAGNGFVEASTKVNTTISVPVDIAEAGLYAIDFRYANGNGPTNTENKCAIRTLKDGKIKIGTIVLPQRGKDEWSNWGWSNSVQTMLTKGKHIFTISLEPFNENMNGEINQAMLDYIRLIKIR